MTYFTSWYIFCTVGTMFFDMMGLVRYNVSGYYYQFQFCTVFIILYAQGLVSFLVAIFLMVSAQSLVYCFVDVSLLFHSILSVSLFRLCYMFIFLRLVLRDQFHFQLRFVLDGECLVLGVFFYRGTCSISNDSLWLIVLSLSHVHFCAPGRFL